ncbi:MAG: transposase [Candidatus Omnitrophica bacterium]|nr:transposase [Candidatus Omnitrophota bacterium]
MSRPLRIEYKNAWYHVLSRGRRKEKIFFNDGDYYYFLKTLSESVEQFSVKIHAYSLMPNHYHLLIQTPEANLSQVMRYINGVYTQRVNKKYSLDGALFRGRYKSILIECDEYLLDLARYIHRNPFKAGLEKHIGTYKWNSHRGYMNKNFRFNWLTTTMVLSHFGKKEHAAKKAFDDFIKKEVPHELEKKLNSKNWPSVLGNNKFKSKVKELLLGKNLSEISHKNISESISKILPSELVNRIIEKISVFDKHDQILFNNNLDLLQDLCIRFCREKYLMKMKTIGKNLDLSVPTISRAYRRSLDEKYSEAFKKIMLIVKQERPDPFC